MTFTPLLLIAIILLILYFCWNSRRKAIAECQRMGVPCASALPFLGTVFHYMRKGFFAYDVELAKKFESSYASLEMGKIVVCLREPELIKQLLVGDFSNFTNRREQTITLDTLEGSLIVLEDEEWKRVRSLLSPTFTSGKLRAMTDGINRCSKQLLGKFTKAAQADQEIDMYNYYGSFTLDTIAATAFGLELDTMNNPDSDYLTNARRVTQPVSLKAILAVSAPKIANFLSKNFGFEAFDMRPFRYFSRVVEEAIKARAELGHEDAKDFLQMTCNLEVSQEEIDELKRKGEPAPKKALTRQTILSNAIIFIVAGYDTTATTLMFVAYNLALNPDWQQRLRDEVMSIVPEGDITFEHAKEMRLMDNIINETLRMYSPAGRLERRAGRDCELGDIKIAKGTIVSVSMHQLHYDPNIHQDPQTFDPDRFADTENNPTRDYTFLPFGLGPRECIGRRLALLEMKICLAHTIRKLEFCVSEKTQIPMEFQKMRNILTPSKGMWLKLKALDQ